MQCNCCRRRRCRPDFKVSKFQICLWWFHNVMKYLLRHVQSNLLFYAQVLTCLNFILLYAMHSITFWNRFWESIASLISNLVYTSTSIYCLKDTQIKSNYYNAFSKQDWNCFKCDAIKPNNCISFYKTCSKKWLVSNLKFNFFLTWKL